MALIASTLAAFPAQAAPAEVRILLEPGFAALRPPSEETSWGALGGLSFGVGIAEQLWLQAHLDRRQINTREPSVQVEGFGASLAYDIDVLPVAPFAELGVQRIYLKVPSRDYAASSTVTQLGLGFDVVFSNWIMAGAVVRYYPLFESDLLGNPAYATISGRIGGFFDLTNLLD